MLLLLGTGECTLHLLLLLLLFLAFVKANGCDEVIEVPGRTM